MAQEKKTISEEIPKILTFTLPDEIRQYLRGKRGMKERGAIAHEVRSLMLAGLDSVNK